MKILIDRCKNLSIVLQGNCSKSNHSEVANILVSYRNIFPNAEIIFCISSSDFIDFNNSTERNCSSFLPEMNNFCHLVNLYADKIAYARFAFSFPPIFRDGAKSHPNHMIEAARNGLRLVSREYVLRVRNDLLFKSDNIIDKYVELYENVYTRGEYTIVDMPIMISSLYTLNPFSGVRLPFHYGDWFHFGRASDIQELWDLPFVDLTFITYYQTNPNIIGTREKERNFFSRLAVEQYIHFEFFSKKIKNIYLSHHNDDRSIIDSIKILLDNFVLCDIYKLGIFYPKYNNGFIPYTDNNFRIMEEDWIVLSRDRSINIATYLDKNSLGFRIYRPKIFPINVEAGHLMSDVGFHFGRSIIIPHDAPGGIVCFGPYIGLSKGKFIAKVNISTLIPQDTECKMVLSAAHNSGKEILNEIEFDNINSISDKNKAVILEINFEIKKDRIDDFEVVLRTIGYFDMSIDGICIDMLS